MKKNYVLILIILIATALIFFALGFGIGKKTSNSEIEKYKTIIDYYFPSDKEVFNIVGKVIAINNNVLDVETLIEDPYVLPDKWKTKTYKAIITDQTKITKFGLEPGQETEISINDIKIGSEVEIDSKENIKDKNKFEAESIILHTF